LFHCGAGTGPHTISNNTIEKSGINQADLLHLVTPSKLQQID